MFYMIHLVCFLLVIFLSDPASSLNFSYPSFPKSVDSDFITTDHSQIVAEAIQVTTDAHGANMSNLFGRASYKEKLKLWRGKSKLTASFNTTFTLNILPITQPGGEGMAFMLTGVSEVPDKSSGQWLGIVNASTNGTSQAQIVAVEFDTRKSYMEDVDDNHLGVNVNSINSLFQFPLSSHGVNLSSGIDVIGRIQYDGKSKRMDIFVSMINGTGFNATVPIDLSEYLPRDVYVGFSASTSNLIELNCVKSWNFISDVLEGGSSSRMWIWIMIPLIIILLLCSGLTGFLYYRKRPAEEQNRELNSDIEQRIGSTTTTTPRRFKLKELKSATNDFHSMNKLGEGGFGTVYKGFLKEINMEVAIKRVSKDSRQGKQEFITEITTISHLEHKNLVKLLGWCYESEELLLIYKYMPNRSLDKFIYPDENQTKPEIILSWERRINIICGVASALDYLHYGCEKRVLHRDVKASNVMLDADFNARLGDFGLARTVQRDGKTHHSTKAIAGTHGYMAPECFLTGRASVEADVYGFGVFVMEVACGQRPSNNLQDNHHGEDTVVDWVWGLYGREKILDAVDPLLQANFDKEQMQRVLELGLACCHPNPTQRPTIRESLQVLAGERAPPILPNDKPAFMWPVTASFQDHPHISFDGGNLSQNTDLSGR